MTSRARAKIPERAVAGEIVTIRALVRHRMESGHRRDGTGALVPRDIVNRFEASYDGRRVFAVDIGPGVSANPYLEFSARLERSGTFVLRWTDEAGEVTELRGDVLVSAPRAGTPGR